jgi:DNA processing protein
MSEAAARVDACDRCLRRTALVAALAGWVDVQWRRWDGPGRLLALDDDVLIELATGTEARAVYARFDAASARAAIAQARLAAVCRCSAAYPPLLRELPDPPAVLHVAGELRAVHATDAVAIVGARRATEYGLEVARALGRSLAVAGVPVVSGLAVGIDAAAHAGAVGEGDTGRAAPVAVLAGGADTPYPPSSRWLYRRVAAAGAVVSEMPPGTGVRRWMFPARNRIIAALGRATIVVEAAERSGSLITADLATDLGRAIGAVPGRITAHTARGSNGLLAAGAAVICGPQDVLDLLAEHGVGHALEPAADLPEDPGLRRLLAEIDDGRATIAALARTPQDAAEILRGLTELEARGLVRRAFGGRYVRVA